LFLWKIRTASTYNILKNLPKVHTCPRGENSPNLVTLPSSATKDESTNCRVARWHILKPNIRIWVNLRGPCSGRYFIAIWSIFQPFLWPFCIFYGYLVYFTGIWYSCWPFGICSLWPFGIVFDHLVHFCGPCVVIWYIWWLFGVFCGHLVYFKVIWYILWSFGIFFPLWYVVPRKIWQPWSTVIR
jgi:hypothetical protein